MQKILLFWKSIPNAIFRLGLISFFICIFKSSYLDTIQAPTLLAHQIGVVVDDVLKGLIASIIFYLVDVHYRHVNDRKTAGINIGYSAKAIVFQYVNILKIIGFEDESLWISNIPNFGIDRAKIIHKCKVLDLNISRKSPLTHVETTPQHDFHSIIKNRYLPNLEQLLSNPFLQSHIEPSLFRLLMNFSNDVRKLEAHLNESFTDGLSNCVLSIGITSDNLYSCIKNDLFYSLGIEEEINGDSIFPPRHF